MQTLQSMLGIEKAAIETSLDDRARLLYVDRHHCRIVTWPWPRPWPRPVGPFSLEKYADVVCGCGKKSNRNRTVGNVTLESSSSRLVGELPDCLLVSFNAQYTLADLPSGRRWHSFVLPLKLPSVGRSQWRSGPIPP